MLNPNALSFSADQVTQQREASGNDWLEFLSLPGLSMGVYHVPAGGNDRSTHTPHDRDEVYVGMSGQGKLTAGGEEFQVSAKTIVYVKAGVEHHFHDVTEDLTLLVFFSG